MIFCTFHNNDEYLFFRLHLRQAPPESGPFQKLNFYSAKGGMLITIASTRPTTPMIMPMLTTDSRPTIVFSMSLAELNFRLILTMKMVCSYFLILYYSSDVFAQRIDEVDPFRAVKQLTSGYSKWTSRFLSNCRGQSRNNHQVRRMELWNKKLMDHLAAKF